MGFFGLFLIALGLSMDAFAVAITNGMLYKRPRLLLTALFFGGFQALMPFLGYYAGSLFEKIITQYAGIISFVILAFIGGKMVYEGLSKHDSAKTVGLSPSAGSLLLQAIATSIDAFAVGVSFVALNVNIFSTVLLIGITTFCCTLAAGLLGQRFGKMLGSKAEVFGGAILLAIAVKSLLG